MSNRARGSYHIDITVNVLPVFVWWLKTTFFFVASWNFQKMLTSSLSRLSGEFICPLSIICTPVYFIIGIVALKNSNFIKPFTSLKYYGWNVEKPGFGEILFINAFLSSTREFLIKYVKVEHTTYFSCKTGSSFEFYGFSTLFTFP